MQSLGATVVLRQYLFNGLPVGWLCRSISRRRRIMGVMDSGQIKFSL
ncbi:hypothetical protein AB00_0924 [Raoultella ornithinolytica 2-156-04_S1_C1]|jgi:hypothetical protein|nr:hypothetical protein AB00_0924 [Raoultella ornithinolytica 2-156-04_S1_C1]